MSYKSPSKMNHARRRLFTDFLKSRRAKISPRDIGFHDPSVRRTKGLRRCEVAKLSGVSTEWYTLFEMGRDRALTDRMLKTVSRTLRLNSAEEEYLRDLMFREGATRLCDRMHPSIEFAARYIEAVAVCVYDQWLTKLSNNRVSTNLFLFDDDADPMSHNLLWRMFARPTMRALLGADWKKHARRHVGLLRRNLARDPMNTTAHELINRLSGIPEFDEAWQSHDVYSLGMYSEDNVGAPYRLLHPLHGTLAVHLIAKPLESCGGHMRWFTPADDATAAVFRELKSA
jgi:hypothetical protein